MGFSTLSAAKGQWSPHETLRHGQHVEGAPRGGRDPIADRTRQTRPRRGYRMDGGSAAAHHPGNAAVQLRGRNEPARIGRLRLVRALFPEDRRQHVRPHPGGGDPQYRDRVSRRAQRRYLGAEAAIGEYPEQQRDHRARRRRPVGEKSTARTIRNLARKTRGLAQQTFGGQSSVPKTGSQTA